MRQLPIYQSRRPYVVFLQLVQNKKTAQHQLTTSVILKYTQTVQISVGDRLFSLFWTATYNEITLLDKTVDDSLLIARE